MPTITEKIIAQSVGKQVVAGEIVNAKLDYAVVNDVSGAKVVAEFDRIASRVHDPSKVVIFIDHHSPSINEEGANSAALLRNFAKKQGLRNVIDGANAGSMYELACEKGFARPGLLIGSTEFHATAFGGLGAFSTGVGTTDIAASWATGEMWVRVPESINVRFHGACKKNVGAVDLALEIVKTKGVDAAIYKALEIGGDAVKELPVSGRLTLCNIAAETGAKNAIVEPDYKTILYAKQHSNLPYTVLRSDQEAVFEDKWEFDARTTEPMIASQTLNGFAKKVSDSEGLEANHVVIGPCTNESYEAMIEAAAFFKNRKIASGTRCFIVPGSTAMYQYLVKEGLLKVFLDAGAVICTPSCLPCSQYAYSPGEGETTVTNCMHSVTSKVKASRSKTFFASAATCAATAVKGRITDPRKV